MRGSKVIDRMLFKRRRRRKRDRRGAPPGEVTHEDVEEHDPPRIEVFTYGPEGFQEAEDVPVQQAIDKVGEDHVTWINVDGLGDLATLEALWNHFEIHPLIREDIVNLHQRPKFEEYPTQDFLALQMVRMVGQTLFTEQVSIVFGEGWIISFQESEGDVFDSVRDRIRKSRPRIISSGSDYLAYALLDALIDEFFPILETYGEWMEGVERQALSDPGEETIEEIHVLKRDFLTLRRALWPLREAITSMQRTEGSQIIKSETRTFLRDAYDHVVRVMDMVETYRELSSSVADVYYSSISHRMNEVMKVLTIVATIFIPLTFVAGVYGMNFVYMPELEWRYGYLVVLLVMLVTALGMLAYFRRKGWL